jgi:hypothetical protein
VGRAIPVGCLQSSQFQQGGCESVFLAGGVMPGHHVGRAFAANNAKPQEVFFALVGGNVSVVGGSGNLHGNVILVLEVSSQTNRDLFSGPLATTKPKMKFEIFKDCTGYFTGRAASLVAAKC